MNLSTNATESKNHPTEQMKARKYLFDLAFDDEVNLLLPEREKEKPTYSQEQFDEAKKMAHDSGYAAGKNSMLESQQQQMNLMLSTIETSLSQLYKQTEEKWSGQRLKMQQIALIIMRKIMPAYVAKNGLDEIEEIVKNTIAEMGQEPRLVIRVAESQFEDANLCINAITEKQAFVGKIVLLGEADLGPSDCRIEWADGGIERDQRKIWQEIDRIMGMTESSERQEEPQITLSEEPQIEPETEKQTVPEEILTQEKTSQPETESGETL